MKKGTTGIHYWDGQEFPKLDQSFIYDLADSMRYVFNNYAEAKAKNALLQDFINQNLDGRLVGLEAKSTLNDIWTKRKQV
jgi:glucose/arabinose dehydrogenase